MTRRRESFRFLIAVTSLAACTADQVRYQPVAPAAALSGPVDATLYLVGDGGEVNVHREAVLAHLGANIDSVARHGSGPPVLVAFLGDNIYDEGAPLEQTEVDLAKLSEQVLALGTAPNVQGILVPGNHDWANGGGLELGRAAIARQRQWIEDLAGDRRVRFLPDDGCPGPATADVGDVHLAFIDSEWLLRETDGECGGPEAFYERLAEDLAAHRERPVILLAHHPLASGGPHGGNVAPLERGPLVYYLASKSGVSRQDLHSPAYSEMRRGIREAIAKSGAPPLIHAAGHDHTLQVIRMSGPGEPRYQLVSGALSKSSNVQRIDGTRYATNGFGYMRLDFIGELVRVTVFARPPVGGPLRPVFACALSQGAPAGECPEAPLAAGD